MKRSAPTPVQLIAPTEAPCVSFGALRTALIGVCCVISLLIGLLCFFRIRVATDAEPMAKPTKIHSPLRMASTSMITRQIR